jgi:hypothetical protein
MNTTAVASELIRKHGVTIAAEKVAHRVQRWADWSVNGSHHFALSRMRFWLGVQWQVCHNRTLPAEVAP